MPSLDASFYPLISWFRANGGTIDESSFGLTTFPAEEGGRGAVALKDIPESQTLFSIPRALTLSTRTSRLPSLFGIDRWRKAAPAGFGLDKGWAGLILCMMWEEANHGRWAAYLASLPSRFDTPMFWSEEEIAELKGTSVVEKLGKADAEHEFYKKLLPAVESRKDLFFPHHIPVYYTLEKFHIHGSRILSRSFTVDPPASGSGYYQDEEASAVNGSSHAMDVDELSPEASHEGSGDVDVDTDNEDEDEGIVSMVPMADMLNARYESENAKLFYEENELKMVSTKPIKAGEQIFNTYSDLPNAELLRRYGHVDVLPLPAELGFATLSSDSRGNPGDVVELRADIVVNVAARSTLGKQPDSSSATNADATMEDLKGRIDWWLEMGGDDVFVLEPPASSLPADLISLIRLLTDDTEWRKAQEKDKPPKAKTNRNTLTILMDVLEQRLALYNSTLEDDEATLASPADLPLRKRNALVVRLGEKRILYGLREKISNELDALVSKAGDESAGGSKRRGEGGNEGRTKKQRR
ncbi:SET domain-containing protein [Pleurotus eryngii]|uniref:Ribosomal lysine N-methyltransferase 4 n=1 Tax=Pleurotus eryngii TaxID=5323 RepID=A0A9P5ZNL5_PLEER|nr:SET domain-containing protein [Pleurotus eryngii]